MKAHDHGRYRYLMMLGHACTDINQGALPAILPFLLASKGLSLTSAAGLVFASNFVSAIVQPLFGYLGDKVSKPWFMSLGIALAGLGIATIGFWDHYWQIFCAVMVSGIGIAIFHPEGGRMANLSSGAHKGTGMSIFAVGGNLGFALGPVIASAALLVWGLKGTMVFLFPTLIMSGAILLCMKDLRQISDGGDAEKAAHPEQTGRDDWPSFSKVTAVIICRAIMMYGMGTFIPIYWIQILMQSEASGNAKLTLFSLIGAVATILGGRLADRYGFTRVIRLSFVALTPVLLIFLQIGNPMIATLFLVPIALCTNLPYSNLVTLGQQFLPNRIGLASGVTLGLAMSIGGMAAPGIGYIGDNFGLMAAMYTLVAVAFVTMLASFLIPKTQDASRMQQAKEPADETTAD